MKEKGREDYNELITCHLIKIMMEDEKDRIRKEAVMLIEPTLITMKYLVKKTLDISHKVRHAVYKVLLANKIKFDELEHEDRISLIVNGLRDPDNEVSTSCKEYLASSICAEESALPEIRKDDES